MSNFQWICWSVRPHKFAAKLLSKTGSSLRCSSRGSRFMTPQTEQWVRKAEGDWDVVLLLRRSRKRNRYDAIRFHWQQCAGKYLKARLLMAGTRVPHFPELL